MPKTPRHISPWRRSAAKTLATSDAFYTLAFEQSPVPMWVVDAATLTFIAVNDAAVSDLGYTWQELLDLSVPALFPSEDLATVLASLSGPGGQAHGHLTRLRRNNGSFLEVHLTWAPIIVEGKPAWLVLLTAPMGRGSPAVALQVGRPEFMRPLPELTADLLDAHRALQSVLAESRATEAQLRATVHARDVALRTMQHQIKTTLQLAMSLFNLQRAQHQDPRLSAPFAACAQRLQVLALLHKALKLASPETHIDGAAYLLTLQAAVIRTARVDTQRIVLIPHLETVTLPLAHALPCGLIFNELLTNAVTHAFPEGRCGMVTIELRSAPHGVVLLRVTDTGIGVPAGLDIHQPKCLGWQLVTLLTQQLHGVVELKRDQGTRITVQWPHPHGIRAHRRG